MRYINPCGLAGSRLALAATLLCASFNVSAQLPPAPNPAPPPSPSSNARASEDAAITLKVKSALMADADLQRFFIEVQTTNGSVALSGRVPSTTIKERARQVTTAVQGVKSVDNRLVVKTA